MKKILLPTCGILLLLLLLLVGAAYGVFRYVTKPPPRPDVPPRVVRSFDEAQSRMTTLVESSENMTLRMLGETDAWPLIMLSFSPDVPANHRVLLTGGVHGNEPAGTEALLQFAATLALGDVECQDTAFDIVPIVNPWGWERHRRRTGEHIDLNRDFATFAGRETVIMRDLCARESYDLMVDLHEDSHVMGFYFYRLAHPGEALCRHVIDRVRDTGHPIHDGRVSRIFRARDGVISCAMWSLRLARATEQLSVSNYFRLQGCPQSFLFESPSRLPLEERVAMHLAALDALLEQCFCEKMTSGS